MQSLAQRRAAAAAKAAGQRVTDTVESTKAKPVPSQGAQESTVVTALIRQLADCGVKEAFGVSGGAIALLFDAIADSSVKLRHFRHETGAAFAATEAHFASQAPTLVFATTGPGLLNALTGITAAKWEGAKVVLISGHTNSQQRGRWASQETSSYTMPQDALYGQSALFDYAVRMESAAEFPEVMHRLHRGFAQAGGFVAHVCMPMSVQSSRIRLTPQRPPRFTVPTASNSEAAEIARLLKEEPFAIWLGFGATGAAAQVRELTERSGARVFCSPRAKGVIAESHPQFLGVTGLGGHEPVIDYMVGEQPRWTLVLGTRLGEATSFWDRDMLPREGFIHVDIDPEVPGTAFPDFPTLAVHAEIDSFLAQLLPHFDDVPKSPAARLLRFQNAVARQQQKPQESARGLVRPQALMRAIQQHVIDPTDAIILSECGNSFAWCNHHLRFDEPGRYRVSTLFGSMGHSAAGVVGAALASGRKALAVVGDGSMLMNSEVSSAAQYGAQAIWVVLNDAGYGMCRDGHKALGLTEEDVAFPRVDFVDWARSMGAAGIRVESEDLLEVAMTEALSANGPYVIDVLIDPTQASPLLQRFESLIQQGNSKNVAGWER